MPKFVGPGSKLIAKNGLYGLPKQISLVDKENEPISYSLPEFQGESIDMSGISDTDIVLVPPIKTDRLELQMELDLDPRVVKQGGADDFLFLFQKPYKKDIAGADNGLAALQNNSVIWKYTAIADKVGGGEVTNGNDRIPMPVTFAVSGGITAYLTYDPVTDTVYGNDTAGAVVADGAGNAPSGEEPTKYFVIRDGQQATVAQDASLTAGQWITHDGTNWVASATWD